MSFWQYVGCGTIIVLGYLDLVLEYNIMGRKRKPILRIHGKHTRGIRCGSSDLRVGPRGLKCLNCGVMVIEERK